MSRKTLETVYDAFGRGDMQAVADAYMGSLQVEVSAMAADGETGFVSVRESATHPDHVGFAGVHLWRSRDGKCAGFESFYDDAHYEFWSERVS